METENNEEKKEDNIVDAATQIAERLEAANQKTEELLTRQEKLRAQSILGGKSEAGAAPPPKDENAAVREFLKGTGYDNQLFPEEKT